MKPEYDVPEELYDTTPDYANKLGHSESVIIYPWNGYLPRLPNSF